MTTTTNKTTSSKKMKLRRSRSGMGEVSGSDSLPSCSIKYELTTPLLLLLLLLLLLFPPTPPATFPPSPSSPTPDTHLPFSFHFPLPFSPRLQAAAQQYATLMSMRFELTPLSTPFSSPLFNSRKLKSPLIAYFPTQKYYASYFLGRYFLHFYEKKYYLAEMYRWPI